MRFLTIGILLLASVTAHAAEVAAPLPPVIPWDGRSRSLAVAADHPWVTPAEKTNFRLSPNYDETVAWLQRLTAAAPELRMMSLGKSSEGRDIWMVVASRDRLFTPDAVKRTGKPIIFVQAGIHSGEIDGKDAGMMLLRDITVGGRRKNLLDRAILLFVPIFNVDGHERASKFGRINQRGPEVIGWRTTARNLNLNRDYTKLDAPEMRAMVTALDRWQPDLYVDLHVTDGADYQYDITFGWNTTTGYSPGIVRWLDSMLGPTLTRDLRNAGHIPGPLVFPVAGDDVVQGIWAGNASPRLSNGYADARHLACVLVENHSLKPYDQRVLGTLVLLESMLELIGREGNGLRRVSMADAELRLDPVPLDWRIPPAATPDTMEFLGVESRTSLSHVSGTIRTEWLGRPVTMRVPVLRQTEVAVSVPRAKAYWIPASRTDIVDLLKLHGIGLERIPSAREVDVEMYRLVDPKLASEAFEGRVRLETKTTMEQRKVVFPAGSWRVPTANALGELITVLLEPSSLDSFLQWGFFHEILQQTEYAEPYMLEPLAEQMMAADPKLAEEFRRRVAQDAAFRQSADQRLRFFYERSPYFDVQWRLYPIARER